MASIDEQIAYYRARAGEYDEWFLREGRYDRGPQHRADWFREVAIVEQALSGAVQRSDVLELACGTGLWTERLVALGNTVHAVDASPEAIAINRDRTRGERVTYEVADLFSWHPPRTFDAVFFSFWLSHVPPHAFDAFWDIVRAAVRPGGVVFFVDSLLEQASTARDHEQLDRSGMVRRKLNDGRTYQIVKVFYEAEPLERRLGAMGWSGRVRSAGRFFLYGEWRA